MELEGELVESAAAVVAEVEAAVEMVVEVH